MNRLKRFFETERTRVFEPDAFFAHRLMARLDDQSPAGKDTRDLEFWDMIPGSTRPVLAVALLLILCFVALEIYLPHVPERGMVESFLAPEHSPAESFLYTDTDVASQDVLQQLIAPEE